MTPSSNRSLTHYGWVAAVSGAVLAGFGAAPSPARVTSTPQPAAEVSFADEVLPIFQNRCAECHGGADEAGKIRIEASLNLLSREGVLAGSEFGSVIEPGDAEGSYLLELIVEGEMPEEGDPVPEAEIEIIRVWIQEGALDN